MFLCEWCRQFNWIFRVLLEASSLCFWVTQVSISLSLRSHSLSSGDKVWGRSCFCTDDMALLAGLGLTGKVLQITCEIHPQFTQPLLLAFWGKYPETRALQRSIYGWRDSSERPQHSAGGGKANLVFSVLTACRRMSRNLAPSALGGSEQLQGEARCLPSIKCLFAY